MVFAMFATAPLKVDVTRDWWDYFVDGFTMLAAVATLAAVIVALFGEDLRARRRRPKLNLAVEPETEAIVVKGEGARGAASAYMQLYAEPGRDKAEDVEMFVSLGTMMEWIAESPVVGVMRDVNINFEGGRLGAGEGHTVTSVLPGMVRHVPLMMFGEGKTLYDVLLKVEGDWLPEHFDDDFCAFLHTFPARQDRIDWIKAGAPYSIFIVIAGSNFDATAYVGEFSVDRVDMAGADEPGLENLISIRLNWTKPLTPHVGPPEWVLMDKM